MGFYKTWLPPGDTGPPREYCQGMMKWAYDNKYIVDWQQCLVDRKLNYTIEDCKFENMVLEGTMSDLLSCYKNKIKLQNINSTFCDDIVRDDNNMQAGEVRMQRDFVQMKNTDKNVVLEKRYECLALLGIDRNREYCENKTTSFEDLLPCLK